MNAGITAGRQTARFAIAWQDSRNGPFRWNTFVRASHDAGASWDPAVDVSDVRSGFGYLHPRGYDADYGDYMQVAHDVGGLDVRGVGRGVRIRRPRRHLVQRGGLTDLCGRG